MWPFLQKLASLQTLEKTGNAPDTTTFLERSYRREIGPEICQNDEASMYWLAINQEVLRTTENLL